MRLRTISSVTCRCSKRSMRLRSSFSMRERISRRSANLRFWNRRTFMSISSCDDTAPSLMGSMWMRLVAGSAPSLPLLVEAPGVGEEEISLAFRLPDILFFMSVSLRFLLSMRKSPAPTKHFRGSNDFSSADWSLSSERSHKPKMAESDDLEFNPLYKCLQTRFRNEFETAQDNCYLVCIPQTASLVGMSISQGIVDTHLLKPSPMLRDHYITTDKYNSKTISVEEGVITCVEGFRQQDTIKVLSEELGYNKNYKPFKMLIIERPLEGAKKGRRGSAGLSDEFLSPRTSYADNCKFLNLFHENRAQLKTIDMKISEFNHTYMILPGYLMDAARKLRGIWEHSKLAFSETNNYIRLQSDGRLEEAITMALESYIMGGVHTKVFKAICQQMADDDKALYGRIQELQGVKADQLGVMQVFCCPLPTAVVELARLDGINNPQEKLLCLKSTLDGITDEVSAHLRMNLAPGCSPPCLTSDELIPLQVLVISQAKCQYLASNLYYMEHFHWVNSDHNDVGYTLVSFKAAMEYMKNTDFTKIMGSKKLKKEMTIDELMAAYNSNFDQDPWLPESSPVPRSTIGNITRMMEKTSVSSDSEGHKTIYAGKPAMTKPRTSSNPVPDVVPHIEKPVLGDFLSALQNDVLDCTYGKLD